MVSNCLFHSNGVSNPQVPHTSDDNGDEPALPVTNTHGLEISGSLCSSCADCELAKLGSGRPAKVQPLQSGRRKKQSLLTSQPVQFAKRRGRPAKPHNSLLQAWPGGKKTLDDSNMYLGNGDTMSPPMSAFNDLDEAPGQSEEPLQVAYVHVNPGAVSVSDRSHSW